MQQHRTTNSYDGVGNRISSTDAMGSTTSYAYDPLNHLTQVTDPLGGTVSYTYDTVDNLVSMTDANGHTTQYTYDPVHRLTAVTDPLGHIASYSYDAAGNTISSTDNNGDTTHLTYDALNRLTGISYHDQTTVSYTYDAVGNRLAMTDGSGTTSYAYDGLNRLTGVTSPGGQLVGYSYDAIGNRIGMTYPDGRTVSYAYDSVNRLSGVTDWTGNVTRYGYDANGNLVNMTYPNGRETGYTYDDANRLLNLVTMDGAGVVSGYAYTLDAVGNRLQVTETGWNESSLVTAYEYDLLNRLDTVTYPAGTTVTYTYDPMGNRLSMAPTAGNTSSTISYTYDTGDRLLSAGGTTYTYDNNGNRIEKNGPDGTTSYGYDAAGRLAGVSLPGSTLLQFVYDGDGNRLGKAVTSGNMTGLAQYVWDVNGGLPQVLTEADGQGTALSLYGLQRISTTDPPGGQIYYQYDGLGSVRGLSDISGTTVTTYSYDAFGEPDLITGQVDNDFLFTGEQMDPETGLLYLRARYYDPETGRFISKDPFTGFASVPPSLNRYTYGYNNPVRFTDPSGKFPAILVPGVVGAGLNEAWYIGEVIGTSAATGQWTGSWCIAAGRAAGGFAGGEAVTVALAYTGNPWVAGAAGGQASYAADRFTQAGLSSIGVPGETEQFSVSEFTTATVSGGFFGGGSRLIFTSNVPKRALSFTRQATKEDWYIASKTSSFTKFGQVNLNFLTSAFERIPNQGNSGK